MARLEPTLRGANIDAAERAPGDHVPALVFIKDVALLLKDCAIDPRVPRAEKWILASVAVYLLSPVDLVPNAIGVLGQLDDLGVAIWALRRLLRAAGPDVVRDLWRGDDEGLALVLSAAGIDLRKDTV
jgi:uncharacterized membrane protein YkvA (DUF1232 family)